MSVIAVEPIWGWGWSEGESTIDVPEPFEADVVVANDVAEGVIVSPDHRWNGLTASLSRRHSEWDGFVDVSIFEVSVNGYAKIPVQSISL